MVFSAPDWVPPLPFDPPDSVPISEFMLNEKYGRHPLTNARAPFTCGLTGKEYSALEVRDRVEYLARALSKELGWHPNKGTEWDKVVGIFSVNTIDTLTLCWAVHSLSGICTPASAAYSEAELEYQLKSSRAKVLFTCLPLLSRAVKAASKRGIPENHIYLFSIPEEVGGGREFLEKHKTVDQLIKDGQTLPKLDSLEWRNGQGARQTAFLCYSSGTSGLPKGVLISHRNVIANVLQFAMFEKPSIDQRKDQGSKHPTDIALCLLPQSHIYSLVIVCHSATYRGDQVVSLPRFDIHQYLDVIHRFKISVLYLVPPIIVAMVKNKSLCDKFDLSSVANVFTGAAPLGSETAEDMQKQYPAWNIRQGYGLSETCGTVSVSSADDIWLGSSGSLLPSFEVRIISPNGKEITEYDQPGELVVRSPSVVLGYLNDEAANRETFRDGWLYTGDEGLIKKGPNGTEHVWIVDRLKELIKVKGFQVAPAELEAHLLTHPAVADAAVISVYDEAAGELPKAFVVKSASVGLEETDHMLIRDIQKHVEQHKSRHKWLKGGVEFVESIPKSPSGKILRRMLRDKERDARKKMGAKL